ncbi:gamma-glutamylcyclotransferase [Rosenbergiella nectarea]|uniref:gamma-glutamylcyclotransferase n=1 Tax=Rosenbergiella nectarea TaxID=988801 RepID=UPI001BDB5F01|nr:gamma-glutamylcyclotransferase [Rosenbergiella nectarea subsp. apis]
MLTREFLKSADCQSSFGPIEESLLLSSEQRTASLQSFLMNKPSKGPLWVFGYGSLMWNPLLDYDRVVTAYLDGWSRDFCLSLIAGRGTAETPGRMLALVEGGGTTGRAFKLCCENWETELALLWKREMLTGCYRPSWQSLTLESGEIIEALVFVANPQHVLFKTEESIISKARTIARAQGPLGRNLTYLQEMMDAFQRYGIQEPTMTALTECAMKLSMEISTTTSE